MPAGTVMKREEEPTPIQKESEEVSLDEISGELDESKEAPAEAPEEVPPAEAPPKEEPEAEEKKEEKPKESKKPETEEKSQEFAI